MFVLGLDHSLLGLERVCYQKVGPWLWPWPQIFFKSLASKVVSLTPPLVIRATERMKLEVKLLKDQVSTSKNEIVELEKSQKFICGKHDGLKNDYNKALSYNAKCNQILEHLNRRLTDSQKKTMMRSSN